MKFICNGIDLSDALTKVNKATSKKNTNPILEGILIEAKGDVITFTATDLELTIVKKIKAEIKIDGKCVVPGKYFSEFVKKLNHEEIELDYNNNQLIIKYGDSEACLQCLNTEEFPEILKMEDSETFEMNQNDFKEIIRKIIFSVSKDDTRPILKGVLLEIEDKQIKAVALDGYRIGIAKAEVIDHSKKIEVVVPSISLIEISKILSENDDNIIQVKIQENYLLVDKGDILIITRLIDGKYVKYLNLIPKDFNTNIVVDKKQFEKALERASIMSNLERNKLVKFDCKEKIMNISSRSEVGNINENVTIHFKGKELVIAFNYQYISESLKVINDDFIELNFVNSSTPCVISPVENDNYLYLILPVRIKD